MGEKPARNRVAPTGAIIASAGRGAWMGNRGRLHEGEGTRDIVREHESKTWITCSLSYKGDRQPQWKPRQYTQLYFLDEAVSFAAGHRPCAKCRRAAYNTYNEAWMRAAGVERPRAYDIDAQLHTERMPDAFGRRGRWPHEWRNLPDGVFVVTRYGPAVTRGTGLFVWDEATNTYGCRRPRPADGTAQVVTPPTNLAILRAGYRVQIGCPEDDQ
jgi:hypothetical protein